MKSIFLLIPVAMICLSSCGVMQASSAMDRNRCAVQRSTKAIESNVEALDAVTKNLKAMQQES